MAVLDKQNSIQDKVLQAINSGDIKPKPKWHFILESAALAFCLILTALLLVFFISLIIFSVRQSGAWFAPSYGFYGLRVFFASLPWLILLTVGLLLVLLEWLLKRYKFAYQKPLLYSFVGAGLVLAVGTVVISRLHFHEEIFERFSRQRIVIGSPFYMHYGMPGKGDLTRGTVLEKISQGYDIETPREETVHILVSPQTQLPSAPISIGDAIIVIGPRDDDTVKAFGIRKIDGSGNYFYMRMYPPNFPSPPQ